MRIALITGIFPPDIGGPATYACRFAQAVQQAGHQVQVLTFGAGHAELSFPVTRISRHIPLPMRLLRFFWLLLRKARQSDVWYIQGPELPAVLAGKLLRKRMVMKIVSDYAWERAGNQGLTTDSVLDFQISRQHWKVELHKALRAWIVRQAAAVITPSQHVQRLVRGWGVPEERLRLVYNAVDALDDDMLGTKYEARQSLHLPDSAYLIITIGRLIALKGIDQLIRAVAALRQQAHDQEDYHLIVVGDGPEKNNLTEYARRLHLTGQIHFIGQVEQHKALRYLRAADLFVLNSSTEGLSHVILETMLVGTPVIATNVGGNPELITHNHNGILITCGDFEALTTQISTVLHDRMLQEQLVKEAKQSIQCYSWNHLMQETMNVLWHDEPA